MKKKYFYGLTAALVAPAAFSQIVINEIDADTAGNDSLEFVELYDGGVGNTSLDGMVLVFINGSDDLSYDSFDLDGFSTDANGFFVIGNPTVANVGLVFEPGSNGALQNGADAVALYVGDATSFPNDTIVTTTDLVDAIVYGTSDGDDSGLLGIFGGMQYDENANSMKDDESIQRNPDGSENFVTASPTPGATNDRDPLLNLSLDPASVSEGDGTSAIFAEITVAEPVVGDLTITINISDVTELDGPTTVTILDGEDFVGFDLDAVDDALVDGVQSVTITASAAGFQDGTAMAFVGDDDLVLPEIVINEMQTKASGDDPQFVELYNNQATSVDLAGWSVKAYESDSGEATFGNEVGSFTIPSGSPVNLASGEFYLVGDAVFESIYGITPDQQAEPGFSTGDLTMILFDDSNNAVYTVLSAADGPSIQANNGGNATVADITVSDGGFSPVGFYLESDGGSFASIFSFGVAPDDGATPGQSNTDLIERLRVEVDSTLLSESAGIGAAIATITRVNDSAGPLTVAVSSSDTSEITLQAATVEFADGEVTQTVLLDVQDDLDADGVQNVTITATATGFASGSDVVSVTDDDASIADLVINEMIVDSSGTDTEFLEIFNAGSETVDLAGYSIEKWDSDSGTSFGGADDGGAITIPAGAPVLLAPGGYYLMANEVFIAAYPSITPDLTIPNDSFENGSATIVLRDVNANVLHSVFATDGGASDLPNIDGTTIVPDAIGNARAFALLPDGDSNNVVEIDNSVPSSDATPGTTNGVPTTSYTVTISDCSYSAGQFVINFTASGSSDIYVSTDLTTWGEATNGAGVASGTYTDTAPPTGKAFYQIQEAGTPAP